LIHLINNIKPFETSVLLQQKKVTLHFHCYPQLQAAHGAIWPKLVNFHIIFSLNNYVACNLFLPDKLY